MRLPPKLVTCVLALAATLSLLAYTPDALRASAQKHKETKTSKANKPPAVGLSADVAHSCTAIEQELLSEINFARTRPNEYANYLEQLKPLYSGKEFKPAGGRHAVVTVEGWPAVAEAVAAMRSARPAPALAASVGMCCGASELTRDQKKSGRTGHQGSDGSFCEQRAERFGTWLAPIGENLSYGHLTARERVLGLLIDDGVGSRGHRKRLLDSAYKVVGIACDDHGSEETLCVITLAGGFTDRLTSSKPAAGDKSADKTKTTALPSGARRY